MGRREAREEGWWWVSDEMDGWVNRELCLGGGKNGIRYIRMCEIVTHSAACSLESSSLLPGSNPLVLGHAGLQNLGHDIPQLVVLGAVQDNRPVSLRVERAGHRLHGILHDLCDLGLLDGQLLVEGVPRAADVHRFEEGG